MNTTYYVFKDNLDRAERILFFIETKRRLDEVPQLLRGPLKQMRKFASEKADEVIDVATPLLIVFTTACLEHYLSSVGKNKELKKMINDWERIVGNKLANDMHEMRIMRNVIIHNAGIVNGRFLKELRSHDINRYTEGRRLELSIEEVRELISETRKFVEVIEGHLRK